jgi:hypothetical protein
MSEKMSRAIGGGKGVHETGFPGNPGPELFYQLNGNRNCISIERNYISKIVNYYIGYQKLE